MNDRRTELVPVDPLVPDPVIIARAAECLRRGGLVAFPTETVYGLGANALDAGAVRQVFEAKGRPSTNPLIVHIATLEQLADVAADTPDAAKEVAARFWPGPLTLVLPRAPIVPAEVTAGLTTVAVRLPAHPVARALIEAARIPIVAPSANLFSRPSSTSAAHVLDDLAGRIDIILDGGRTAIGVESTVLDLTGPVPVILRPGAVSLEAIRRVLPRVDVRVVTPASGSGAMPSPGLLSRHYSPRARMTLYEGPSDAVLERLLADADAARAAGTTLGVLVAHEDTATIAQRDGRAEASGGPPLHVRTVGSLADLAGVAASLYAALRDLDALGVDEILARGFPGHEGLGLAIEDRLRRAAAGRIVDCSRS